MKLKLRGTSLILIAILVLSSLWGCGNGAKPVAQSETKTAQTGAQERKAETEATDGQKAETTEKNKEPVTLTLYGSAADSAKPYMQRMFKLYEEATGNKIDVQGLDTANFENVCLIKFQTGDIPDILMHFGGFALDAYNPAKNFVDFSGADWISDLSDTALDQATRNGVVYGLPLWESSVSGCFYNKKIFAEQGLTVPTNQDEFEQVCAKLKDAGIQPIFMPAGDGWPLLYQFGMDPIFSDKALMDKINKNEITYSEIPEMEKLLTWYKTFSEKGYFGKNYMTDTFDYASEVLGTGEAAMFFCWDTWFDTDYDSVSNTYKLEDFGMFPAFMGTKYEGSYEGGNNSLLLINKNGPHVETAREFIEFCADPDNYNIAFDGISTTPTLKGMTTCKISIQYKEAKESIDRLLNASVSPQIVGYNQGTGAKCIQELLAGNLDVKECLKLMDEERIKEAQAQKVEGF